MIEAPESPYEPRKSPDSKSAIQKGTRTQQERRGITLGDLIGAGMLTPPLKVLRRYKETTLEAILLPDGKVEFQQHVYPTCSAAAHAALKSVKGRRNVNGWAFWQYQSTDGVTHTLDDARKRFARSKSKFVGGHEEAKETGVNSVEDHSDGYGLRK
jgi:hypothetical protein